MSCGLVLIFRATSILKARISQKGMKVRKPREELESERSNIHNHIRFIATHQYHVMEGNNDEKDVPEDYV